MITMKPKECHPITEILVHHSVTFAGKMDWNCTKNTTDAGTARCMTAVGDAMRQWALIQLPI